MPSSESYGWGRKIEERKFRWEQEIRNKERERKRKG
jgi:hypothetical protein